MCMSISLVGYSKNKTNMNPQRVSFDDTNCSQCPSEKEWKERCILAEANFLLQEKIYTQKELYRRCEQEKARRDAQEKARRDAQDDKEHAWNTPLTPQQVRDMMADQVMNRG